MPLVKEVAESIKLLGDVVKSTREIIKAVNDGREYLKLHYPDAQSTLRKLLEQMQRAIEGLASATKVISGFRFMVAKGSFERESAERDLTRLNDYLIAQREKTDVLRNSIRDLKADCEKVRELRNSLDARTQEKSWGSMFGLLGSKARERSVELASALGTFYADDQRMLELLGTTLQLTKNALTEVEDSLGPPGIQDPYNVPVAAEILGTYAVLFRAPHEELHRLADELNAARIALTK